MRGATIGLVVGKVLSVWMLAAVYYFYVENPLSGVQSTDDAGVVGNLFAFVYTYAYAMKYAQLRPHYNREYWMEIFKGAFPYGIALVFNMIYFRIDSVMILFMKGPEELGYYGPAVRMLEILQVIPVYFMNSVLPVLSRSLSEDRAKVERILTLCMNCLFMAAVPMAGYLLAYHHFPHHSTGVFEPNRPGLWLRPFCNLVHRDGDSVLGSLYVIRCCLGQAE
jgi:O-antigen/teichoic acid export membrane protein